MATAVTLGYLGYAPYLGHLYGVLFGGPGCAGRLLAFSCCCRRYGLGLSILRCHCSLEPSSLKLRHSLRLFLLCF